VSFAQTHGFSAQERLPLQTLADALALALERTHLQRALEDERAQVAALDRRLGSAQDFSSGLLNLVATELRSPLASVKAYGETLGVVADQDRSVRSRFLGVIQEECDRMAHLLSDVSDLSRIEGGECTLRLTAVTLADMGQGVVDRLTEVAGARGVRIESHCDDARIEVDTDLMRRAIENLVQNAIEFSPEGGTVRLSLTSRADDWTCVVQDEGPPLPEADLSSVFDFHRASRGPSGRRNPGGSERSRRHAARARDHARRPVARGPAVGRTVGAARARRGAGSALASPRRCADRIRARAVSRARRPAGPTAAAVRCHRDDGRDARERLRRWCSWIPTAATCSWASTGHEGAALGRRTAIRSGIAGAAAQSTRSRSRTSRPTAASAA
jgi:hypothetical protein